MFVLLAPEQLNEFLGYAVKSSECKSAAKQATSCRVLALILKVEGT
jgi:hypothetical protein